MNKDMLVHIGWTIFGMVGGSAMVFHLGVKFAPDALKGGAAALLKKYPAARHFVAKHAPDLVALAQAMEKAEEDVISQAQKDDQAPS